MTTSDRLADGTRVRLAHYWSFILKKTGERVEFKEGSRGTVIRYLAMSNGSAIYKIRFDGGGEHSFNVGWISELSPLEQLAGAALEGDV